MKVKHNIKDIIIEPSAQKASDNAKRIANALYLPYDIIENGSIYHIRHEDKIEKQKIQREKVEHSKLKKGSVIWISPKD